jgi:hypothetical protein
MIRAHVLQCKTTLEGRLQRAEQQLARERLATSDELAVGEQRKLSDSASLRVYDDSDVRALVRVKNVYVTFCNLRREVPLSFRSIRSAQSISVVITDWKALTMVACPSVRPSIRMLLTYLETLNKLGSRHKLGISVTNRTQIAQLYVLAYCISVRVIPKVNDHFYVFSLIHLWQPKCSPRETKRTVCICIFSCYNATFVSSSVNCARRTTS